MQGDGTHRCAVCRTDLNASDVLCWRCGARDILAVAAPDEISFDLLPDVPNALEVLAAELAEKVK